MPLAFVPDDQAHYALVTQGITGAKAAHYGPVSRLAQIAHPNAVTRRLQDCRDGAVVSGTKKLHFVLHEHRLR
jgi:hypothetical protein